MATTMTLQRHTMLPNGADSNFNSDGPRKKRKYIPGGPGGGGQWIEVDMTPEEIEISKAREARLARRRSTWKERTRDAAPATVSRPRREPPPDKPTYTSAADAVALVDGYKPREERSWEEFHPDLDLEGRIPIFSADEVDGVRAQRAASSVEASDSHSQGEEMNATPTRGTISADTPGSTTPRRRPGRPPGRKTPSGNMLNGLGIFSPPTPRPAPLPIQNPRERLNLPKPSYRRVESLDAFEQDKAVRQNNFVTKTMESLGYQKTDRFSRNSEREMIRLEQRSKDDELDPLVLAADAPEKKSTGVRTTAQVEYDMDEQDEQWLDEINRHRRDEDKIDIILPAVFEVCITQIEKEWHAIEKRVPKPNPKPPQTHRPRSSSSAAVNGEPPVHGEEQDSKCAICDDGDCENTNAIVFCDGCDLAVHQECYGVPYIPEGQWLCRKCQHVGKAVPTCIFCPITDGAFKMTTESKWAHLVCSIWIPEVTIANPSFMEPITGVADVQKARWKLNCYICNQKMGACIQCANRNCYQAFHVTCARKAKLCLRMKPSQGGVASLDASTLKAFCDKHVPSDWRQDHNVDGALAETKAYFRREMKGRRWADSQESALSHVASHQNQPMESIEDLKLQDDILGANATPGQKKKRLEMQKKMWRLPSGAPVVPAVIFNAVESALQKFNPLPKRKEFVAEVCKYWTLKREARRGASLIKRLQLMSETFTTSEIARRDFAAMGPTGGPRLQRRIDFARQLEKEMTLVRQLCDDLREREALKLRDAESLAAMIDTVYFPITALLRPILDRAKRLDEKTLFFTAGLIEMQNKINCRAYTSVATFSANLSAVLQEVPKPVETEGKVDYHKHAQEVSKVAKRILHQTNAGGMLRDAMQSESELAKRPYEHELKELEAMLNPSFTLPPQPDAEGDLDVELSDLDVKVEASGLTNGIALHEDHHGVNGVGDNGEKKGTNRRVVPSTDDVPQITVSDSDVGSPDLLAPLRKGGIPWFFERFDPVGTTIHDERWDGAERAMSAELSEMDEEELTELGIDVTPRKAAPPKKASNKKRKRNW